MTRVKQFISLLQAAFAEWSADKVSRLAAALAFYTALSLAPLLIFLVAVVSIVLSGDEVQASLIEQATGAMGESGAEVVTTILNNSPDASSGVIASVLSLGMLLFSASGLFNQLQDAFNTVWKVPQEELKGIFNLVWLRAKALGMVFGIGIMIVLTLAISIAVQLAQTLLAQFSDTLAPYAAEYVPGVEISTIESIVSNVLPLIDVAISFLLLTLLFAWMFKNIPHDKTIQWGDVRGGAILTTILFIVGKFGLAWYLGGGSVGSAYGAAGSLLVVLVWVYYSAQIVFLGAEYAYVYANRFGSRAENVAIEMSSEEVVQPADSQDENQSTSPNNTKPQPVPLPTPLTPAPRLLQAIIPIGVFLVGLIIGARDTNK